MPRTMLQRYLKLLAPGTPLRGGIDRILHGRTGALIVLGNNRQVSHVSSGGFQINVDFSEQALRELAKLDGAIILSNDLSRIIAAGVHLVPSGDLPTAETGTRHRSADRTAQAAGVPVVTVSASMGTVSLFINGRRHVVENAAAVSIRANQTLAALGSLIDRLQEALRQLDALEISDQVTIRDVVQVAHRYELVRRLSSEMDFHLAILGVEGRMLEMQHVEQIAPLDGLADLLVEDYAHNLDNPDDFQLSNLLNFTPEELLGAQLVAERLGFGKDVYLESAVKPRGYRLLTTSGRLPRHIVDLIIPERNLQEVFEADASELQSIEGIGTRRAKLIRDGLTRLSEANYPQGPVR